MPPPDIKKLETDIYSALEDIDSPTFLTILEEVGRELPQYLKAHLELEHSTPSPSGIMDCRLMQWFKGKEVTPDEPVPAHWTKRATVGTIMEPFWIAILRFVGLDITLPDKGLPCGPHMLANPDCYIGNDGIGELKDRSGWVYKRLIEGKGIAYEEPKSYYQIQSYLHATNRDWGLYMATPADPGMLQSIMRSYKRYGERWNLPLVYLEVVPRRDRDIRVVLGRGAMVVEDLLSDTPPTREYDGQVRKGLYPCNICRFRRQCNEINT